MIKLYNTLKRTKENFKSIKNKQVGLYTCGPTVYDFAHIGNLRTYIFEDILKRVLEFNGYKVNHIENITDVDDKTIRKSIENKVTLKELTQKYEKYFLDDLEKLNIEKASVYPHASDNISEMQKIIQKLLDNDIAYLSDDGSIYFNIKKYKKYGQFANLDIENLMHGKRIASDNYEKEGIGDFALWKAWQPADGNNFWLPEFKIKNLKLKICLKGRPGWHIECSAMSNKYLGQPFDIHAGAVDLIFPHHQNEIAQSESAEGKTMADYWLHGEHLLVDGHKMSKSLKNYYTLSSIEKKGIEPLAFRYLCLETHYRSKLNFTWDSLQAAQNTLNKIRELGYRQNNVETKEQSKETKKIIDAFNDDLDSSKALALLHKANNYSLWLEFEPILGLGLKAYGLKLTAIQNKLIKEREQARADKDFKKADDIRVELEKQGIIIEDTADGTKVIPKK
jgi:cysteinyl-tRNA synthetase